MTEKVHSHVLQCSNVSDKRLLNAYMKIPSSRSGSTVVMDDRSKNLLFELSSIRGLPYLSIVSYFKSGIKDLSWKKKARSCSFVSFPPVLSSWMKYIRMISSPWVYIRACLITVRNVHKAKGYISFSQQLVSVRHSYHIREDRSCLEGPNWQRRMNTRRKLLTFQIILMQQNQPRNRNIMVSFNVFFFCFFFTS